MRTQVVVDWNLFTPNSPPQASSFNVTRYVPLNSDMVLNWELPDQHTGPTLCRTIVHNAVEIAHDQVPELVDLFPFRKKWVGSSHIGDDWVAAVVESKLKSGIPALSELDEEDIEFLTDKLSIPPRNDFQELYEILGDEWFSFDTFTYVGPYDGSCVSWPHIQKVLIDWMDETVLPEVLRRNEERVLHAVPGPPQISISDIRDSIWVVECKETFKQGTAFYLEGAGLVTCEHVIGPSSEAFHPDSPTEKYPVEVRASNDAIDLALVSIDADTPDRLPIGNSDNLEQMDHVVVVGFPNFRYGDTGTVVPGLVTGFRPVSSVRRILTNAPIVAGNSGSPVLNRESEVVGVAVTGADIMEEAQETENHGIIPIDALKLIS